MINVLQVILFILALIFICFVSFMIGYSRGRHKTRLEYEADYEMDE